MWDAWAGCRSHHHNRLLAWLQLAEAVDNGIISPQLVSLIDAIRSPTEFALGKLEHKRMRGAQGEGGADAEEEG